MNTSAMTRQFSIYSIALIFRAQLPFKQGLFLLTDSVVFISAQFENCLRSESHPIAVSLL